MFACDTCMKKAGVVSFGFKSYGTCEVCSDAGVMCGDIKFKSEDAAREWVIEHYNDIVDVMQMTDALGMAIANTYFSRKFRNREES